MSKVMTFIGYAQECNCVDFSRFLVATRNIKADEIIIDAEEALAAGPKQATHPVNKTII
jgi:hypothetical protein